MIELLAGAGMVVGAVALTSRSRTARQRSVAGAALRRGVPEEMVASREQTTSRGLAGIASASRMMTPGALTDGLEAKLSAAGLQGAWSMDTLAVAKLGLGTVGFLMGLTRFLASPGPLWFFFMLVFTFGAWYAPDLLAGKRADARRARIQNELPDTLDQLTIAVEAGLGFDGAMLRVAQQGKGPLAEELRRALQDIQLGMSRADALGVLSDRVGVVDVRRFVAAIRQSERYGVPIATVLRSQAAEVRDRRRQRAEEHAMKIPVKVLFPLMFFILPTLFMVILGPAVISYTKHGGIGG